MLSYRHSFHAGNFADVIKHICLVEILTYLAQKEKPLCYIDTHSGSGAYALHSVQAQKNQEHLGGISKLWPNHKDQPEAITRYLAQIKKLNPTNTLQYYPGSPWLAQSLLREHDRAFFCELHPNEIPNLEKNFKQDKRIKIRHEDGLLFLNGILPCQEKRGLVLIDPSYEVKTEYQQVVNTLKQAHKRQSTLCYALWYPVVVRETITQLEKTLRKSGIRNILLAELSAKKDKEQGMSASGMIIINPPWQLAETLNSVLPFLAKILGDGTFRCEYLVNE